MGKGYKTYKDTMNISVANVVMLSSMANVCLMLLLFCTGFDNWRRKPQPFQ